MNLSGQLIKGTGSYSVQELTAQDAVLKHLDKGSKYLRCDSAGTVAIPSDQAYGEWEWDWWKDIDSVDSHIYIIAKNINNIFGGTLTDTYRFTSRGSGIGTELIRNFNSNNIMRTADGYFDIKTWYKIKITRTLDGVFTMLAKGGNLVPTDGYDGWHLVLPTSLGANPGLADNFYTKSTYFALSLYNNDRIANLIMRKAVQQ